jgi:hypothetical protein
MRRAPVTMPGMTYLARTSFPSFLLTLCCLALAACTPRLDWREVRGADARFVVLLPAKPASHTRPVNLDGMQINMTMTAAEVDGVTFAIGSASLADRGKANAALQAMKTALIRNIGGTLRREKALPAGADTPATVEIEAVGPASAATGGRPRLLVARFMAKDERIYQVLAVGPEPAMTREALDTFFDSFKLR